MSGRRCGEAGSIALYFAMITVAAFAVAGLVVDGGAALATRERAADLATQAARAGANALSPATLHGPPSGLAANPAAADRAAHAVLADGGATGTVLVDGDHVTVTAHLARHTVLMSAVGWNDITESATVTASVLYGDTRPEGGG